MQNCIKNDERVLFVHHFGWFDLAIFPVYRTVMGQTSFVLCVDLCTFLAYYKGVLNKPGGQVDEDHSVQLQDPYVESVW